MIILRIPATARHDDFSSKIVALDNMILILPIIMTL